MILVTQRKSGGDSVLVIERRGYRWADCWKVKEAKCVLSALLHFIDDNRMRVRSTFTSGWYNHEMIAHMSSGQYCLESNNSSYKRRMTIPRASLEKLILILIQFTTAYTPGETRITE